jgi:hypothetical protein
MAVQALKRGISGLLLMAESRHLIPQRLHMGIGRFLSGGGEGHERHRQRRREGRGDHARTQACNAGDMTAALVTPATGGRRAGDSIAGAGVVSAKRR